MIDNKFWNGLFEITVTNKKTNKVVKKTKHNLIVDNSFNELVSSLTGSRVQLDIQYLAVGDDDTPITTNDALLGNETFRTAVSSQELTDVGEIQSDFTILTSEANGQIEEIGIFCSYLATSTRNTGTLLAIVLWSHLKTSDEEITIRRIDRFQRPTIV